MSNLVIGDIGSVPLFGNCCNWWIKCFTELAVEY
jgi:hypothetical protein